MKWLLGPKDQVVSLACNSLHACLADSWCLWRIYGQLGGIWPFGGKSSWCFERQQNLRGCACVHRNKGTLGRAVTAFCLLKSTQLINSTLINSVRLWTEAQILLLGTPLQMLCDFCVLKWNWKWSAIKMADCNWLVRNYLLSSFLLSFLPSVLLSFLFLSSLCLFCLCFSVCPSAFTHCVPQGLWESQCFGSRHLMSRAAFLSIFSPTSLSWLPFKFSIVVLWNKCCGLFHWIQ